MFYHSSFISFFFFSSLSLILSFVFLSLSSSFYLLSFSYFEADITLICKFKDKSTKKYNSDDLYQFIAIGTKIQINHKQRESCVFFVHRHLYNHIKTTFRKGWIYSRKGNIFFIKKTNNVIWYKLLEEKNHFQQIQKVIS